MVLPARITWDGDLETFAKFQNRVQGHYSQTGAGYMFDTEFQQAYLKEGSNRYIYFTQKVHSSTQIEKDAIALYGALLSACPEGTRRMILITNWRSQDGIKAWIEMLDRYEADRNINLHIKS